MTQHENEKINNWDLLIGFTDDDWNKLRVWESNGCPWPSRVHGPVFQAGPVGLPTTIDIDYDTALRLQNLRNNVAAALTQRERDLLFEDPRNTFGSINRETSAISLENMKLIDERDEDTPFGRAVKWHLKEQQMAIQKTETPSTGRTRFKQPPLKSAAAARWRQKLRVDRKKTIDFIRKLAKKAGMDPPLSLPDDDAWILYAINTRRQWRKSPDFFKHQAYGCIEEALETVEYAQKLFGKADVSLGALQDVQAIFKRMLDERQKDT